MFSSIASDLFNATPTTVSLSSGADGAAVTRAAVAILIMVLGVLGNGTIIAVIVRTRSLQNITGVFLVNLAVADMCVAIWSLPFIIDAAFMGWWRFGHTWCQVSGFLGILFTSASISTLGLISYDRYVAIVKPLHYQQCMTAPRATIYLIFTWVLSIICACLPMTRIASYAYIEDIGACTVDWEASTLGYIIAAHVISFCLPLGMILFCYAKIFIVARKVKRQIRPLPANFAEHPSRWVNEKSGCDKQTGPSKTSAEDRCNAVDQKWKMASLPERIASLDSKLCSKVEEVIKSPQSERNFNIRKLLVEDRKRSKSAQEIGRDLAITRQVRKASDDADYKRVNFSVHKGLSMVPSIFQSSHSVPAIHTTDCNANNNSHAARRILQKEKQSRRKHFGSKQKSSNSGDSGEITTRHISRKAVRLKKMQSLRDTKAATTLLILLGVFLVCWMPYVVITFLLNSNVIVRPVVHSALYMITLTNSVLNVFVYGVLNTKFRVGFRKMWKPCCICLKCRCKSKSNDLGVRIRSISQSLRNNGGAITDRGEGVDRREFLSEHIR